MALGANQAGCGSGETLGRAFISAGDFNPRPPSPKGDAGFAGLQFVLEVVSIHAPRLRGAMLGR